MNAESEAIDRFLAGGPFYAVQAEFTTAPPDWIDARDRARRIRELMRELIELGQ